MTVLLRIAAGLLRAARPPWFPLAEYHSVRHLREHGAEEMLAPLPTGTEDKGLDW